MNARPAARRRRPARSFTLIETVFSVLIVGVLVGAVLGATRTVADTRLIRTEQRIAAGLAAELAAEIYTVPFGSDASSTQAGGLVRAIVGVVGGLVETVSDLVGGLLGGLLGGGGGGGGGGGQTAHPQLTRRIDADELNDYAYLEESPPRARDGSPVPGLDGWSRVVTVQNGIVLGSVAVADTHAKTVNIIVISPRGVTTQWTIVRTKDADPGGAANSAVAAVTAAIEVGDARDRLRTGVHLINRPPANGS